MTQGNLKAENSKPEKGRRPPRRISATYLHNAGLHYLQRFATGSAHFRKVMMRKIDRSCAFHKDQDREKCVELLDSMILRFQESGLLNDGAYTRGMIDSLRRRGLSSRMIHAKLQAKGLGRDAIVQALSHYEDDHEGDAEIAAALKLARRKKLGPFAAGPQAENHLQKSLATLARAGFSYEIARRVLDAPAGDDDFTY